MINSEKQKSTRDMKERERKRYNELKKQIRTLENNNYELHINLLKVKEEMKLLRVENLIAKNEIAKMVFTILIGCIRGIFSLAL